MINVPELFGINVFNDEVMKERLPTDVYRSLHRTISRGRDLDITVATAVANAMKEWAIEKGATHFTHWFQPMTGITAEKHDSFISPSDNGKVIMEFSGKELIKGESDASSFPSGGLRATFEARGYTAWDPTSYAFIKDGSLCIPSVFCSYGGHALDSKTPLLRSMEAINEQALRILRLFGNTQARSVITTTGAEQEYFLVDKSLFNMRKDLIFCGRTLFGARPPKGQEMDDHYFGAIKPRVSEYMAELDSELWKLGVLAKTKHNEAAPSQHELAPIFTTTNTATDHNQLTMEVMKKVADKHGFVCLLHEKPFAGVNGSGKHNNWSISTDTGINLLEPGKSPHENAQFLLILAAIIKGVDEYQDLIRVSVATAGNDHRLGGAEAPPAIVSIFLGDEITSILDSIENDNVYSEGEKSTMEIGVHVLPSFPKDSTDRNRTSPLAFTGNKFEFRMPGSSQSIGGVNTTFNTIVAQELEEFADILENAESFNVELNELIKKTIHEHKRIIFNGDGYSAQWQREAKSRGLLNLPTTVDALPYMINQKNISLYESHNILTAEEVEARYGIKLSAYRKLIKIEALTLFEMINKNIIPAAVEYSRILAASANDKRALSAEIDISTERQLCKKLSELTSKIYSLSGKLRTAVDGIKIRRQQGNPLMTAKYCRDEVLSIMSRLRPLIDEVEALTCESTWTLPTYSELLFSSN